MIYSGVRTHVVIDNHTAGIYPCGYSVVEHKWYAMVYKPLEMFVALRVLCLRHNDSANLMVEERLAYLHFLRVFLIALCHHDGISAGRSLFLYAAEYRREEIVGQVGNNHTYGLQRYLLAVAQTLGNVVWRIVARAGVFLYSVSLLLAYPCAALQGTRNGCHGNTKVAGNIFHRNGGSIFVHRHI